MSHLLPPGLVRSLNREHHFDETLFFDVHNSGEQVTSIRLNPFKYLQAYESETPVPWSKWGRYLPKRPLFTADPLFHAGCYYVQEASSMFLEQLVKQTVAIENDLRVLDLCGAPGGKSTHLCSLLSQDSLLVANEPIKTRVLTLADNLSKWGTINTIVTHNDPEHFSRLGGFFDLAVVDAPCSGSGMFRKDPAAIGEWSENAVTLCSQRQKRILADVYPALKEGSILIYSTCSYSREENEDIADWLCETFGMEAVRITIDPDWGIEETVSERYHCTGYRFYPYKLQGEGFFVTCLLKTATARAISPVKSKPVKIGAETAILKKWLSEPQELSLVPVGEEFGAIRKTHEEDLRLLQSKLYLKKSGVHVGRIAGKDLVPDHELAVSLIVSQEVNRLELSYEQAISYLRKDEVAPGQPATPGWTIMCYQDFGLGWAKILPNRINNYYPKELRILKEL